MPQLTYAQAPQSPFPALAKNLGAARTGIQNIQNQFSPIGGAVPGAQGPTSVGGPQGPQPLVAPGTPGQTPSAMDVIKGMSPPQILNWLRNTSGPQVAGALGVPPPGQALPGPQALAQAVPQAGMLPPDMLGGYGGGSA
jgi:hypothetical protein